jgi:hypothetical protein
MLTGGLILLAIAVFGPYLFMGFVLGFVYFLAFLGGRIQKNPELMAEIAKCRELDGKKKASTVGYNPTQGELMVAKLNEHKYMPKTY